MTGQIILDQLVGKKQIPEHTYYVSPSFTDNPSTHEFSTIQGALDVAIAYISSSGYTGHIQVIVHPGTYVEQINDTHDNISIISQNFDPSDRTKDVILYNTGADAAHYPLANTGRINLSGITVKTAGGIFGEITNQSEFLYCMFDDGYFIDSNESAVYTDFRFCVFTGDAFKLEGATSGWRFIALRHCDLYNSGLPIFGSDASGTVKFEYTLLGDDTKIRGNWSLLMQRTELYSDGKLTFDTNGSIDMFACIISNGMHFVSDTTKAKKMRDCVFKNTPAGVADITADVDITGVAYNGNDQQNGISGNIQITDPVKNVGAGAADRYFSLQDAVTSIAAGECGTIRLWKNLVNLPEITLPNANTDIGIDGQKRCSMSFTGDIIEIGADRKVSFMNMTTLSGGNAELNGVNAEIGFEDCQYLVGYLTLTLGAFAIIYKSSIFGSTGHKAININNTGTIMVVGYSRVQGSTGNPAVIFTVDADGKFKAKFSTFVHGDKGVNAPLVNTAVGKVDIAVYSCGLNNAWDANKFTNVIGSANNTTDPEVTF